MANVQGLVFSSDQLKDDGIAKTRPLLREI